MIRVGIVGSDNSHAVAFSKLLNAEEKDPRWADAECVALYGTDQARNAEVAQLGRIPWIAPTVEEMLDKVDAAMVVWRHGHLHASHALPFIQAGIPTFVDKPFAIHLADCQAMLNAAAAAGALLTSYSTTRYCRGTQAVQERAQSLGEVRLAQITAPADLKSEYGGIFFYANHGVEIAFTLCGHGVQSVTAREGHGNIIAVLRYPDGRLVDLTLVSSVKSGYWATLHGTEGRLSEPIDISNSYQEGLAVFLEMIRTGQRPLTNEQLLEPTRLLHAIMQSLDGGQEVLISEIRT